MAEEKEIGDEMGKDRDDAEEKMAVAGKEILDFKEMIKLKEKSILDAENAKEELNEGRKLLEAKLSKLEKTFGLA